MIKDIILDRINKIKLEENNFNSYWWKDIFISYDNIIKHISEIDFNDLPEKDLVRIFEYIIMTKNDMHFKKVKQTYFSEYDVKSNL